MNEQGYFSLRREMEHSNIPVWLPLILAGKEDRVLEIGCGKGKVLDYLRGEGFERLIGLDVDGFAVSHCREMGLDVRLISDLSGFIESWGETFDLVLMLHVLEHIKKDEIVAILRSIRSRMSPGARIVVSVPNAQSPTGSYWAYEDFTHSTIFTSGSLYHVLADAGFAEIQLVDPAGVAGLGMFRKMLRLLTLALYRWSRKLINRITGSSWHAPSPEVYTFEVKAVAFNL